ncbi:MAG: Crp/Fnr family transcriptional regulator [Bacteroides sp.]|nr:Crp/Fnr family transcriptional regulator [Bacteroides sp.]MCM1094807.1 Crp/Fnr family transcriptional regulator [Terasakiella sp.]
MSENFNTYIPHIEPDYWRRLCMQLGCLRRYERGEAFAREGEPARYIGYVAAGALKYVTGSDDGEQHVIGLEYDGGFVADFPFSLYGMDARASIVATAPSEIYCVEARRIGEMMQSDRQLKDIVMKSTEAIFATLYDRYKSLYNCSPARRYEMLLSAHGDIFARFPLKDIASYLDISPTHLSRLRHL